MKMARPVGRAVLWDDYAPICVAPRFKAGPEPASYRLTGALLVRELIAACGCEWGLTVLTVVWSYGLPYPTGNIKPASLRLKSPSRSKISTQRLMFEIHRLRP